MKTLLIVALLAIAATSAVAQLDIGYGELQWQQQPWQLQLNPCRAFLQQQCSPVAVPFLRSRLFQLSSCQVMQQQCCQQLTQIAEQSRCQAICGVAQAIMQQQLGQSFYQPSFYQPSFYQPQLEAIRAMALHTLPTMCNVLVPPHCATMVPYAGIPTTVPLAGIPTTATCAGGACF